MNHSNYLTRLILLLALMQLSAPAFGFDEIRFHYAVKSEAQEKAADLGSFAMPESFEVYAAMELSAEKHAALAWHFRNAARLAQEFAKTEKLSITRQKLPGMVIFYQNPMDLAQGTRLPSTDRLGQVVARIALNSGTLHLGRATPFDLYMELGKWFFYEPGFKWGANQSEDERHQALIKRFANYCLTSSHWHEEGGSKNDLR